ncbi:metallophosphoesterase [Labilithrix luteola]|uniref:Metallophosphoesterase n=1 Tax=Labilithrix luteola TaxID=1391654 RepID=A0A0K1PRQ8_9BACT|nr:metallophosphoesterase [Labilithrix luteola]AKU96208.1 metallophosphoesterase [Labilithrix luteola]
MLRIAHLSDVHILDPHTRRSAARYRITARAVSMGRSVDPRERARKLSRGLAAAKASGAGHVVISGDLTELGDANEFEHFATLLDEARLPDGSVTLVPGNHDAYTSADGWKKAMAGPLKRWSSASAFLTGQVVERGDVVLMPIDTSCFQSIARSGGHLTSDAVDAVHSRLRDPAFTDKSIILVFHHPPFVTERNAVWQWIDGLRGYAHAVDLLGKHPRLQILHGHLHKVVDSIVRLGKGALARVEDVARLSPRDAGRETARARIFGAPAVVDDGERPRVRLYDVRDGALESAGFYAT